MELDDAPGLFVASSELGDPVAEYDGADDLGPGTRRYLARKLGQRKNE